MRTLQTLILSTLVALVATPTMAQTAATYADRAKLSVDAEFQGRIAIAAMVSAIGVITEDEATPNHATRVKLAAWVLREPEFSAQRLGRLIAATGPAQTDTGGKTTLTLTDAQLLSTITARWDRIAAALVGGVQ